MAKEFHLGFEEMTLLALQEKVVSAQELEHFPQILEMTLEDIRCYDKVVLEGIRCDFRKCARHLLHDSLAMCRGIAGTHGHLGVL